jgi:hypothetical protein
MRDSSPSSSTPPATRRFLLAALAAILLLLQRPKEMRSADHGLLIALVLVIGLGSLAFHLLADRASLFANVVPIDVFMLVYLGFALNRFFSLSPGWTLLTLIGFATVVFLTTQLKSWGGFRLASAERACAVPPAQGEPRDWTPQTAGRHSPWREATA